MNLSQNHDSSPNLLYTIFRIYNNVADDQKNIEEELA
jgi:hypothetical protein